MVFHENFPSSDTPSRGLVARPPRGDGENALTRRGSVCVTKALAPIPFARHLEEAKKSLMVPMCASARVSVGEIRDALNSRNPWVKFLFDLNAFFALYHALRIPFVAYPLLSVALGLLNGGGAFCLARMAVRDFRRKGGGHRLAPAVRDYLKAHRDEEKALRRKVDGFNRALEARQGAEHLLKEVNSETRSASSLSWRKRRAALQGDVDAYLAGMHRTYYDAAKRERLYAKAETYRRLEAAMRHYPDSGGYDKTVDLSVYQEVAQAFQEIEEEAEHLGIPLDELGVNATPLLTEGEKVE